MTCPSLFWPSWTRLDAEVLAFPNLFWWRRVCLSAEGSFGVRKPHLFFHAGRSRPSRADACKGSEDWIMAKIFRFLTPAAAWSLFAFIAYATLSPLDERPEIDGFLFLFSHFDHYIAYATMGCLFGWAYPRQTFLVCILVLGGAVLLELAQLLTPDRHARVLDATRKIIGGTIGIAFAHLGSRFVARRIISRLPEVHENE